MSKFPVKAKVGPFEYTVEYAPNVIDQAHMRGQCDLWNHKILIDDTQPEQRKRAVLVHELIHAMTDIGGLSEEGNEEKFISVLAPIILQFLQDNRSFVYYLMEEDFG